LSNPEDNSHQETIIKAYANEYHKHIVELARQESYTIAIKVGPVYKRIGSDEVYWDDSHWQEKEFERHKILKTDYEEAHRMTALLNKMEEEDDDYTEDDVLNQMLKIYAFWAECYLHMSSSQFYKADWQAIKDILNACEYRTNSTLPTFSHGLQKLFYDGKAQLTQQEYEVYEMYRLWKKWRTKPWEINGGKIYIEDIKTVLKLEDFEADTQKKEQNKSEQRSGLKQRAAFARAEASKGGSGT